MTTRNADESIKWPDGIRRWSITLEDLKDCSSAVMPYRISNKTLSLDFESSPLRVLGKQAPLSPRLSSTILKYSTDHPLSIRLHKSKVHSIKETHSAEMDTYTQINPNAFYGLQCIWTTSEKKDYLPMHILCNITEKQDSIIAEYDNAMVPSEKKIYLRARRSSEGELLNCMRRLQLNGCPVIVCQEVDDDTFAEVNSEDQSSATCLSVPSIDIENEKKRPPLPSDKVNIVVC